MPNPPINEILNFLNANVPSRVAQLKKQFPQATDVFIPDKQGVADEALRARGEAALAAMEEVQPKAASLLSVAIDRNQKAEKYDDYAALFTAVAAFVTAGLLLLKDIEFGVKVAAAGATFLSSFWSVMAKKRRRALFTADIASHAKTLAASAEQAKQIAIDLRIYLNPDYAADYSANVTSLIDKANALAQEVNKAQIDLGQFPRHALD